MLETIIVKNNVTPYIVFSKFLSALVLHRSHRNINFMNPSCCGCQSMPCLKQLTFCLSVQIAKVARGCEYVMGYTASQTSCTKCLMHVPITDQ